MNIIHTAINFPPSVLPLIQTLLNVLMWVGVTAFVIGLAWGFIRLFAGAVDDNPGSNINRGKYIALVLVAGLLMSSASGIAKALIDTPLRGSEVTVPVTQPEKF